MKRERVLKSNAGRRVIRDTFIRNRKFRRNRQIIIIIYSSILTRREILFKHFLKAVFLYIFNLYEKLFKQILIYKTRIM